MYILQISDLHINKTSDINLIFKKIDLLEKSLSKNINCNDKIVCCLLGDFVEKGEKIYEKVELIVNKLKDSLAKLVGANNYALNFIPGNHDLCRDESGKITLSSFNNFIERMGIDHKYSYDNSICINDCFGYKFVNISSILNEEYKYGQIDFELLEKLKLDDKTIINIHHSLISSDSEDNAVIRSGAELQRIIEDNNVLCLLHGHTHGFKKYSIGDCCIIGVGPFLKYEEDIANQINLIDIRGTFIKEIKTFSYHGDRKVWDIATTFRDDNHNIFKGNSVRNVYNNALECISESDIVFNMFFNFKQNYSTFINEIETYFKDYIPKAEMWLLPQAPKELKYTHGQYLLDRKTDWIDYTIKKLSENPTSKRAIIPLIEKEMILDNDDDNLICFDVLQVSFDDSNKQNLFITVYFRALEIGNFLPINLCEIALIAKKINEYFDSIENIEICLFAFKAEYKDNYACYEKSEIELLSESELCKLIALNDYLKIKEMLDNKASMTETVISVDWVGNFKNAIKAFYNVGNKNDVINKIEEIDWILNNIKAKRKTDSDYVKVKDLYENLRTSIIQLRDLLPTI